MNASNDFDRLLGSWLESAGPTDIRPEVTTGALAQAERFAQRGRLNAWLAGRSAWPRYGGRPTIDSLPPAARTIVVLALVAALVGGALTAGALVLRNLQAEPILIRPTSLDDAGTLPRRVSGPVVIGLDDGRVLIAGAAFQSVVQVFDPATGETRVIDDGSWTRIVEAAIRLADGRVFLLTAPNATADDTRPLAWVFDPATTTLSAPVEALDPWPGVPALLADGRVLLAGGGDPEASQPSESTEIFDPTTGTFVMGAPLSRPRREMRMVGLPSGEVLLLGGEGKSTAGPILFVEAFDPVTGALRVVGAIERAKGHPIAVPMPDGRVLIVDPVVGLDGCGVHEVGPVGAFMYDPARDTFDRIADIPHGVRMAVGLADGRVVVQGHWSWIPGGCASGGEYVYDDWLGIYDPTTGITIESRNPVTGAGTLPVDPGPLFAGDLLADGRVAFLPEDADGGSILVQILTVAPR